MAVKCGDIYIAQLCRRLLAAEWRKYKRERKKLREGQKKAEAET